MRFHVNGSCIGCGLCVSTCPQVFQITDENVAKANDGEVAPGLKSNAIEAKNNCPVAAIEVVKGAD
jgi:ferredoxin